MSRLTLQRRRMTASKAIELIKEKKPSRRFFSPDEIRFVCKNSETFPFIFDAAAMGQYLGGVDPNNNPGDTRGFVNESCAIRYDLHQFEWEIIDGIKKPFLVMKNGQRKPIFNLHIHCKKVASFMG